MSICLEKSGFRTTVRDPPLMVVFDVVIVGPAMAMLFGTMPAILSNIAGIDAVKSLI